MTITRLLRVIHNIFVQLSTLYLKVMDAQLVSPTEAVCPGNRIIFTCQQTGDVSRWRINLRMPSINLQSTVRRSQNGSILTLVDDPGFNFEVHVVSNSSNSITSKLQVIAVRDLNDVTVECGGSSGTFMSTIRVASVGE